MKETKVKTLPKENEIPSAKELKEREEDEYHYLDRLYEERYQETYLKTNNAMVDILYDSKDHVLIVGSHDLAYMELHDNYSEDKMQKFQSQHFSYLWVKHHIVELKCKGYKVVENKPLHYEWMPFAELPLNNIVVTW